MVTKKTAYVNKTFSEEVRNKAYELIKAGKIYVGGFWANRDQTCKNVGYGSWESVPEKVKACVNQIGRGASKRGKEEAKQKAGAKADALPLNSQPITQPFLSKEILEKIALGDMKVPKATPSHEIKIIREYVTVQAGFDPNKTLLGIDSLMEH